MPASGAAVGAQSAVGAGSQTHEPVEPSCCCQRRSAQVFAESPWMQHSGLDHELLGWFVHAQQSVVVGAEVGALVGAGEMSGAAVGAQSAVGAGSQTHEPVEPSCCCQRRSAQVFAESPWMQHSGLDHELLGWFVHAQQSVVVGAAVGAGEMSGATVPRVLRVTWIAPMVPSVYRTVFAVAAVAEAVAAVARIRSRSRFGSWGRIWPATTVRVEATTRWMKEIMMLGGGGGRSTDRPYNRLGVRGESESM